MLRAEVKRYNHGKYCDKLLRANQPAQRKDGEYDS